ncbi:hypothetical protein [Bacillus cereus]|uniref:Uncharacterized protein n=1 Tax=Bacillus cereus HuA3-9 TaxID=1053205 RepID=R8C9K1_BACCE|nr:hypothetical protein [Bacillus cereus]EOO08278.1 hypothetical protein IGA_06342 [Bacillus cereus HuA3-9]
MIERANELKREMKKYKEDLEVIRNFMFDQKENIPVVVLSTLREKANKLNIVIDDCEIRLKCYE